MMKVISRRAILIAYSVALMSANAAAENYPSHPVKILVPFPPGGSNDIIARIFAQKLSERTGQQFFVENRGGAGGNIGAEAVAKSSADGYTLLVTAPPPLIHEHRLYNSLPFTGARLGAGRAGRHRADRADGAIRIAGAERGGAGRTRQAGAGHAQFGSSGNGTTNHLAGELLKRMTGVEIVHVPYNGAAPGHERPDRGPDPLHVRQHAGVLPQVRGGSVRAIAVAGARRASALPDVPTVAEQGVEGFEAFSWFGLVAPAKRPRPCLRRCSARPRRS